MRSNIRNLEDQVAVVTGDASRQGRVITVLFAEIGDDIVFADASIGTRKRLRATQSRWDGDYTAV
jgi:NAD(P)-dependent dehydrogenase (short-subunit alcohol dehydrogenase family)